MSLVTVLLPGFAQTIQGRFGVGLKMFVGAVIGAALTGGVAWLGVGLWSYFEQKEHAEKPPRPGLAAADADMSDADDRAETWLYKIAGVVVLFGLACWAVHKGIPIKTLSWFGFEVSFGEGALAKRPEASETSPPPPIERPPQPSEPKDDQAWSGTYRDLENVEYHFTRTDRVVKMREVSRLWLMPVETATCEGEARGQHLRARCKTLLDLQGTVDLVLSSDRETVTGTFTADLGGAPHAVALRR